ncbi:MAG TPA: MFS transporter [Gemmatimonadales bacterium]|nr:MFS transporter [Gemmatimonadales bacterium]
MTEPLAGAVPRPVKGLSAVSLFNDFASEMVYPVLPAFVTTTLGGSAVALGALDGAADLTSAAIKWGSGRLADRPRWTKPLIFAGYGLAVLIRPLIAVAGAAWQVVGFRVLDRVGKGLRSPARDALVSSLTPPPARGRAFGFHRAADHFGAVLGALAAWLLLQRGTALRDVIGLSVVPGILAVIVLVVILKSVNGQQSTVNGTSPASAVPVDRSPLTVDAVGRDFWLPVVILVLLTAGRLPETLLLLRLQDLGVPVATIPLVWAALHVVRSGASYPGGWLVDRLGTRGAVAAGALLYAVVATALAAALSTAGAIAVFLCYGVVAGLLEPAERVAITRLAPVRTGRGFGNYQGLAGLAALPAGLGFGLAYRNLGGPAALLGSATCLAIGVPLWLAAARARALRV